MKQKLKHITNNAKRKEILRWIKIRSEWMYMDSFLNPIHKFADIPISLHIGSVKNEAVQFIPVLFLIIADTKEANDIVGIRGAPELALGTVLYNKLVTVMLPGRNHTKNNSIQKV
jgi:hypothetical protein